MPSNKQLTSAHSERKCRKDISLQRLPLRANAPGKETNIMEIYLDVSIGKKPVGNRGHHFFCVIHNSQNCFSKVQRLSGEGGVLEKNWLKLFLVFFFSCN